MKVIINIPFLSYFLIYFPSTKATDRTTISTEESETLSDFNFAAVAQSLRQDSQNDAIRLKRDLFENYTKIVRPVRNQNNSVVVKCDLVLKQLIEVVIKRQEMTLLIWNRQAWTDQYLVWDPAKYGGITSLRLDPLDIWVPDVVFLNSVREFEQLREVTLIPTRANFRGDVKWLMPLIKSTTCQMNVRYFPYDRQTCKLTIGSWSSYSSEVDVALLKPGPLDNQYYMDHHEWELVSGVKRRVPFVVSRHPLTNKTYEMPFLEFEFTFARKPMFYEKSLLIPPALIGCLGVVNFLLPNDAGEKIGFSITVFLSLCVNLVVITDYIPTSSKTYPIIGDYYIMCIFLIAMSILQSAFVLSLHHQPPGIKPVPDKMRTVVFDYLGPYLGFKDNPFRKEGPGLKYLKYKLKKAKKRIMQRKLSHTKKMTSHAKFNQDGIAVDGANTPTVEITADDETDDALADEAATAVQWDIYEEDEMPESECPPSPSPSSINNAHGSPKSSSQPQLGNTLSNVAKMFKCVSRMDKNIAYVIAKGRH